MSVFLIGQDKEYVFLLRIKHCTLAHGADTQWFPLGMGTIKVLLV